MKIGTSNFGIEDDRKKSALQRAMGGADILRTSSLYERPIDALKISSQHY